MSSDSYALATVGQQLGENLRVAIPDLAIPIRDIDSGPVMNKLVVEITYQQGDVSAFFDGQRLAPGWVAVDFELGLTAPEQDLTKANETLLQHLPALISALDAVDNIQWDRAARGVDGGGAFYKLPITIFATTKETDNG
ncbi:hypothetical protein [Microbacterium sp. T2.11-28]|uniref:hypothetical protein n=1 Tax=Microbacterium sp. T2.11-28 TaxID=3041169 RepID=UPI0024775AF9|nr:hypothetical protein [Microbacterium sp. T2.11-28]CAI9386086.1 hypothetical protein MICABA_00166 [Microbacterium sp. T2.11-28]